MDVETKSRFDEVDGKIDAVDRKIDAVDAKIDRVEGRLDAKIDRVAGKIDAVDAKIDRVEGRLDAKIDRLAASMDAGFASLAKLIEEHGQSLQKEMAASVGRLDAALARNTKVLTGGSKSVAGLMHWAEKRDVLDRKRDEEIRELRTRIQKLERGSKRRAS